jgi:hypothetical protein
MGRALQWAVQRVRLKDSVPVPGVCYPTYRSWLSNLSFANNQAESKGIHLPAHAWVLYLTEHRLDQMNPTRM